MTKEPLVRSGAAEDNPAARDRFADAYRELRKLAHARLRAGRRDTLLDTTGLVHESYLRLAGAGRLPLSDRGHFLSYAGRAMRSVIVDLARKRQAERHGGGDRRVTLHTEISSDAPQGEQQILRVHEALEDLGRYDPRMVQVVEMRYFAGMSESEIAGALAVTERTVRREWVKARIWLAQALG